MNLPMNAIRVDPARYQRRSTPFSRETVEAIVREGWKPEKCDPIPVFRDGDGWVVAGDGHSRYEAASRIGLSEIPAREIPRDAAEQLARNANMCRRELTPYDQGHVFAAALAAGESAESIAAAAHCSPNRVIDRAALASLTSALGELIDRPYGISIALATRFAKLAQEFDIDARCQQELYRTLLANNEMTPDGLERIVRAVIHSMVPGREQGFMFDLPPNIQVVIGEFADRQRRAYWVRKKLIGLMRGADLLCPALRSAIERHAEAEIERLAREYAADFKIPEAA